MNKTNVNHIGNNEMTQAVTNNEFSKIIHLISHKYYLLCTLSCQQPFKSRKMVTETITSHHMCSLSLKTVSSEDVNTMQQILVILCFLHAIETVYYGKVGRIGCLMYNGTCEYEYHICFILLIGLSFSTRAEALTLVCNVNLN